MKMEGNDNNDGKEETRVGERRHEKEKRRVFVVFVFL